MCYKIKNQTMRVFLVLCIVLQIYANNCGYDACTKSDPNAINVHMVAHSHDDVGWLKTVHQYYYGYESSIQQASVQDIINSVVNALQENAKRKFIQVESVFLWKWWSKQTEAKRKQFRDLVNNGQIEIIGGAWSMNDEATVNYQSVIDQFTLGLNFLNTTFGNCSRPKIGWQIDPFGHTREMASIFAQIGYEALFFARLDWRDKEKRVRTKTAEMLWKGSANLGNSSLLFTHVLNQHYSAPGGFYFDVLSDDEPLVADENSPNYNLKEKIEDFTKYVKYQARHYVTNNIIVPMGMDFAYQDALYSFQNLDILIKGYRDHIQKDKFGRRIKLFYSTPACYTKAVNEYATTNNIDFKVKTDDFIPYASDSHSYWSGYFTSRPTQKRFERQANNLLQVAKQLSVATNTSYFQNNLRRLKSALGIMQHHDAISGTEKEHVAKDYARIVMSAITHTTNANINTALPELLAKNGVITDLHFSSCLLSNISSCKESQSNRFVVSVYNPLSRNVSYYVKLPVDYNNFKITGPKGKEIEWQLLPTIANFNYVHNIKPSKYELVFRAESILPLGIQVFYVENLPSSNTFEGIKPDTSANKFRIGEGKSQKVQFNENTGFLHSVSLSSGLSIQVKQSLMYYVGAQGNNDGSQKRSSGAYIFRPCPQHPVALNFSKSLIGKTATYKGKLVDEFHQTYNKWIKQIVRVYKDESFVEFDWLVGPIDHSDSKSKEVISRFETNVNTDYFFTDSNGREIITRRNDYRETYDYSNEEPVAGNYYPITSAIGLRDELQAVEAAVLTDRSQGGASLKLGEMELMVHRSLLRDDDFGVEEPLHETEFGRGLVVRGQHFFILGGTNISSIHGNTRLKQREVAQRKLLSPWVFIADAKSEKYTLEKLNESINFEYFGLKRNLPDDIQILTMEPWNMNKVLLRFENILEISEGGRVTKISLKALFKEFDVLHLEEYTLAANQKLNENQRLQWKVGNCLAGHDCESTHKNEKLIRKNDSKALDNLEVELGPMQIRTFLATIKYIN